MRCSASATAQAIWRSVAVCSTAGEVRSARTWAAYRFPPSTLATTSAVPAPAATPVAVVSASAPAAPATAPVPSGSGHSWAGRRACGSGAGAGSPRVRRARSSDAGTTPPDRPSGCSVRTRSVASSTPR